MKKYLILLLLVLPLCLTAQIGTGTARHVQWGPTLPAACNPNTGDVFFNTTTARLNECTAANTWTQVAIGVVPAIPSVTNLLKGDGAGNAADSGLLPSSVVLAVAPGAGLAHFAGGTQTETSSAVVNADISGLLGLSHGALNLDLTATGGVNFFLRQNSAGGQPDVVQVNFTALAGSATAAQLPNAGVFTGDVVTTFPVITVTGVNGAVVPTSAVVVGSNASKQLVAATTTGSGTTAVLGTSPAFTTDIHCVSAGGCTLGTAALPAASVFMGNAATNNIKLTGTSAAARIYTFADVAADSTVVLAATSTTTTQVLHAGSTAGLGVFSTIVAGDLGTTMTPQFLRIGLNQAADATASVALTQIALGTTTTVGELLQNTTAAANNAQQFSPAHQYNARGWGGSDQAVIITADNEPIQAATNPDWSWVLKANVNGAGLKRFFTVGDLLGFPTVGAMWLGVNVTPTVTNYTLNDDGTNTTINAHSGGTLQMAVNNVVKLQSSATLASFNVPVQTVGITSSGTKFTTTGCSVSATTGGAAAGTYTSGTTGTCTVVVTIAGATGVTAPNGWSCWANDRTTTADKQQTTASTTTTVTISGTTVSGDVVDFGCLGY